MSRRPRAGQESPQRSRSASWKTWLVWSLVIVVVGCAALGGAAWWAIGKTPAFYATALNRDASHAAKAGDELERRALELRNSARRAGSWSFVVTEEEANGWLIAKLGQEFPQALPSQFQEPRVAVDSQGLQIGVQYREGDWKTVVSAQLDLYLTDQPNEIAVEFKALRAGWLPLPLERVIEPLQAASRREGVPIRWTQAKSGPVAIWTVPDRPRDFGGRRVVVERVEKRAGQIVISGRSEK